MLNTIVSWILFVLLVHIIYKSVMLLDDFFVWLFGMLGGDGSAPETA